MAKVYPNVAPTTAKEKQRLFNSKSANDALDAEVVLTVWKKSLLFNCHGFTVYDGKGNLVFRVDNYMATSGNNGEIVLMDAAGKPLLTIRRKRLSLGDNWLVYEGETAINPRFLVKKHVNILNTKYLAHVSPASGSNKNKESVGGVAFGVDVFRLIVDPEMDTSVAMAMVILLDQMFGSARR
ncbi:PROTEIN LURP-ONE-RELATED 8-LIKE [Salix koriyanagi]|uniref:PROTEIN LURP-ONE-RELATED 8-LIKE n=1 Tax=Salix koriyanagi TaxID=2511006 RepID=A0A9Q0V0D0_9ROSI|nr:PROTEIN LURP-ONE-RELATED 8-LIKE [Salix koriyanagi]